MRLLNCSVAILACSADDVPVFNASARPAVSDCIVARAPEGEDAGEPSASILFKPAAVRSLAER